MNAKYFVVMKVDEKIGRQGEIKNDGKHLRHAVVLVGQYVRIVAEKVGKSRQHDDQADDEYHFDGLVAVGGQVLAGALQLALPVEDVLVVVDDEYVDDEDDDDAQHVPVQSEYAVDGGEQAVGA